MTTIKNVFNNYINQDDIYDYVINAKRPRMSLKPAISICMILFVCLVGQNFMQEKGSDVIRDDIDKVIMNTLTDDYIVNEDYLLVQASPSITNVQLIYEDNPFIKQLEKDYNWEVYYARLPNADELKEHSEQSFVPLYKIIKFVDNEKEIVLKIIKQDMLLKQYDNYDSSIINNRSVFIYKNSGNYYALYEKGGLYYEVKSTNLNENEFIDVLKLILGK